MVGAAAGTLTLQPRSTPVLNDSRSTNDAEIALERLIRPQPSWLFGAVWPAPSVGSLYWPIMSTEVAAKIPFTRADDGLGTFWFSMRC